MLKIELNSYISSNFNSDEERTIAEFNKMIVNRVENGHLRLFKFTSTNAKNKHPTRSYYGNPIDFFYSIMNCKSIVEGLEARGLVLTPDIMEGSISSPLYQIKVKQGLVRLVGDLTSLITFEGAYKDCKSNSEIEKIAENIFGITNTLFKYSFINYFYLKASDVFWNTSGRDSYFIFDKYGDELVIITLRYGQ